MSLSGLRVISLESRRAAEMELLIRKQQGEPFVAPSVAERPLDDPDEMLRFYERMDRGEFDMLVLMTGVGLAFWRDAVVTRYKPDDFGHALSRVTIVSRGPKPVGVLRELGIRPSIMIPEPNTWREIVTAVEGRPERRIALQEYGRSNTEFVSALRELGAEVSSLAIYRWDLPADTSMLFEAARRIAGGECDLILFTTSVQLDHLFRVAAEQGIEEQVRRALAEDVVIASVGPIMTAALEEHGFSPDIVPNNPKMGALVRAAAEEGAAKLALKRRQFARTD